MCDRIPKRVDAFYNASYLLRDFLNCPDSSHLAQKIGLIPAAPAFDSWEIPKVFWM